MTLVIGFLIPLLGTMLGSAIGFVLMMILDVVIG